MALSDWNLEANEEAGQARVMKEDEYSEIIHRALNTSITDIGQLTKKELRDLNKAVKKDILTKGRGGIFPIPKTVYAKKGYDIAGARKQGVLKLFGVVLR